MQYTINQLLDSITQKILDVYNIFKDFYGEEYVDLQMPPTLKLKVKYRLSILNLYATKDDTQTFDLTAEDIEKIKNNVSDIKGTILVWWPTVTVTNEHNKSVNIKDLYAKVEVDKDGKIPYENMGFLLNRTSYTAKQFVSDYMHSHIQGINRHDFTEFMPPCLGRGPIKHTITSLKIEYDETLWMLFCQELSMYVTVESLTGGPWRRMEFIAFREKSLNNTYDLKDSNISDILSVIDFNTLKQFIIYYLQNGHLSFDYKKERFEIGIEYFDYMIDISNSFITYYNKYLKSTKDKIDDLFNYGFLTNVTVKNNKFYSVCNNSTSTNYSRYEGKYVLTFKGEGKYIFIENDIEEHIEITTLISHKVAMFILKNILNILNFRYKNEHNRTQRNTTDTSAYKRVCYL